MRICPRCNKETLSLKNIFSLRYECKSCNSVCSSSTGQKAVGNILINILPLLGILFGIISKSGIIFITFAVAVSCVLPKTSGSGR